ncbi:CEP126 [Branchiostoma lanceolatum]|uniref:CEP126 protein n=1 Tax=Branchiostoma lanceolatum TaxID=7740 RepID=A0A8J9V9S1_BRALA|nr:CEP126 [Branchiostoma lanceolatum]
MLTGAYSDKYKLVQQDQVQLLRTNSARRKEQDRAKTLRQETLRRRKALEDKKKHDVEREAKRREQELAKRRERQQEATEKFQRAHVRQGSARGRKSRTPTLDEVLRQVRGTSRASVMSGTSTRSGVTSNSARTVFSRKYGGSNPDLSAEPGGGAGLQYGKLTAEMRTTSERNLASSKKMFEEQLEEQNRLLAEQQQRTIKELHEEVEHLRRSSSLSSLDSLDDTRGAVSHHHPAYRTDQPVSGITVDSKYTDPNYVSQGLYAQGTPATRTGYDMPYGQYYSSTLMTDSRGLQTDSSFRGQTGYPYQTGHDTNFQANGYNPHGTGQQPAIVGRPRDVGSENGVQSSAFSSATSVPTNSGSSGAKSFLGVSGVRIQHGQATSPAHQQRLFTAAGDSNHHAYLPNANELQVEEANELVQDALAKTPQVMTGSGYGMNARTATQAPYSNPRYRLLFSQKKAWGTPTSQAEEVTATPNSSTISSGAGISTVTQTSARIIPSATTTAVSQTTGTGSVTHTTNGTSSVSGVSQASATRTPPTSIYSRPLLNYTRVTENTVTSTGSAHNYTQANGYSRTNHDRESSTDRLVSYTPASHQGRTASGAGISVKGHAVSSEQPQQLHDTQKRLELLRQERETQHVNGMLQKATEEEEKESDHQSDAEEFEEEESEPEPPKPKIIRGILKKKSKYESHPTRPFSVVITGGRQIQDSVDLAKQEKKKRGIRWVDLTYDDDEKERKSEENRQTNATQLHVGTRPLTSTQSSRPTTTPQATAIQNGPTRLQTGRRRVSSAGSVRKAILARAKAASRQGSIAVHANDNGSSQPQNEDGFVGRTPNNQGGKPSNRQLSVSTCSYSVQAGSPSQPQASTQMPRKVENTKQSNTQMQTGNENEIYSANGLRLDKTPTDDEINWLWDKVRSCLNQRPDRSGMESAEPASTASAPKQDPSVSGSRQTAQMSQLTLDGGRLAGSEVVPKLRTMPRVGGFSSTASPGGRRRTASDNSSASLRRNALLQQRNQQRANTLQKAPTAQQVRVTEISQPATGPIPSAQEPGNRPIGVTDSEVTESLAAFLEAEYMSDQPISEAEISAALDAMQSRQTGQKAPSALSMEERRLLQSLDRLNQRLKVTETVTQNAATTMTQKPPLHPGTRNALTKPKRVMSATTTGPRYHFRTGSADTNTRSKKNYVYQ